MLLSGAWGKVIHEINLKQKFSWHCPFKTFQIIFHFSFKKHFARWEENPSMGSPEMQPIPPPDAEALVPEELETEGSQKQEEEEEELGILQYLDQLEQVTARFLSRLVLLWKYIYIMCKKCSLS